MVTCFGDFGVLFEFLLLIGLNCVDLDCTCLLFSVVYGVLFFVVYF